MTDLGQDLSEWIGRSENAEDEVTGQAARRIAALLDQPPRAFAAGDRVPGFWSIMLFGPFALCIGGQPDDAAKPAAMVRATIAATV